jgi:hypothetical protein
VLLFLALLRFRGPHRFGRQSTGVPFLGLGRFNCILVVSLRLRWLLWRNRFLLSVFRVAICLRFGGLLALARQALMGGAIPMI